MLTPAKADEHAHVQPDEVAGADVHMTQHALLADGGGVGGWGGRPELVRGGREVQRGGGGEGRGGRHHGQRPLHLVLLQGWHQDLPRREEIVPECPRLLQLEAQGGGAVLQRVRRLQAQCHLGAGAWEAWTSGKFECV